MAKCACGKTALYKVGTLGFCGDHRQNAVKIQALIPTRARVFIPDGHKDMAVGGADRKVTRMETFDKLQRKKEASHTTRKKLLSKATGAEMQMLGLLQSHPATCNRWRFQETLCGYFPDFVNHWEKIVIEIDGWHHTKPEGRKRDAIRSRVWASKGYGVLRFYNREVLTNPEQCLASVIEFQKGNVPEFGRCYPIAVTKAPPRSFGVDSRS